MQKLISLVIATTNKGKTEEIRKLLTDFPITIKNLEDFAPFPAVIENGRSFLENACKKASFTSKALNLPALADDSGLVVETLGGKPGIHSARYAGETATDEQRCTKLLHEMRDKKNRKAAFHCVIAVAVPDGTCLTYSAVCEGTIAPSPAGTNGFGYDPVFYYPPLRKTFAQLSMAEKNAISHRGKALKKLGEDFNNALSWIEKNMSSPATEHQRR